MVMQMVQPKVVPVRGESVDVDGLARSLLDKAAAEAAGFAPAKTVYERGTMVIDVGVENARRSRQDYEKQPLVTDYCDAFIKDIGLEARRDNVIPMSGIRMTSGGRIVHEEKKGALELEEKAFGSLLTRTGIGGSEYLRRCSPKLRAINVNHWMQAMKDTEVAAQTTQEDRPNIKLRTRNTPNGGRAIFGAVSDSYTAFDVDKVAEALALATPRDARGTVSYDGYKAQFSVLFHSNVQPENYVCGEFFKSGVIVRTDDTGGGSLIVSASVWQNLCLNLIIVDEDDQVTARIRHIGDVRKLALKFEEGFAKALGKLDHFLRAWGYASKENVVERARKNDPTVASGDVEAFKGILRGVVENDIIPVKGNVESAVSALFAAWEKDESSATATTRFSRSAVANAFTRYAHETNTDPFAAVDIAAAAGSLVYSNKPLPYVAQAA